MVLKCLWPLDYSGVAVGESFDPVAMGPLGAAAIVAGTQDIAHLVEQVRLGGRRSQAMVTTRYKTQSLWPVLLHFHSPRCNILPLEQAIAIPRLNLLYSCTRRSVKC